MYNSQTEMKARAFIKCYSIDSWEAGQQERRLAALSRLEVKYTARQKSKLKQSGILFPLFWQLSNVRFNLGK